MGNEKKQSQKTGHRTRNEAMEEVAKRRTKKRRMPRIAKKAAIIVGISVALLAFIYMEFKPGDPLPIAKSTSYSPINDTDFFSGKPVGIGSPTTIYKGYKIGFCCGIEKQKWENTPESIRDKLVWPLLRTPK